MHTACGAWLLLAMLYLSGHAQVPVLLHACLFFFFFKTPLPEQACWAGVDANRRAGAVTVYLMRVVLLGVHLAAMSLTMFGTFQLRLLCMRKVFFKF